MFLLLLLIVFIVYVCIVKYRQYKQKRIRREKDRLRKLIKLRLQQLSDDEKCDQRLQLYRNFWSEPCYQRANTIGFYLGNDDYDVGTQPLIYHAANDKKQCYVSRRTDDNNIEFVRWNEPSFRFQGRLDLLIVPGLAFDRQRNRLGDGTGDYDRYIAKYRPKYVLALAFREQIMGSMIPVTSQDQKVHLVLWNSGK